MAYTQVQTITDTDRRHITKRVNSGNTESNVLVVNASALAYTLRTITTDASSNNFRVGETVNATSGGSAIVQDVINSTSVVVINVSGTFADNDTLTGFTTGKERTQNGAIGAANTQLHVQQIYYNVSGNSGIAAIQLEWEGDGGGANNRVIAVLNRTGHLDLEDYIGRIPNNANNATGNIILSCLNWSADSHYTLILDVSKISGYAQPYYDRNVGLVGY